MHVCCMCGSEPVYACVLWMCGSEPVDAHALCHHVAITTCTSWSHHAATGHSVCAFVHGFEPYFLIEAPDRRFSLDDCEALRVALNV